MATETAEKRMRGGTGPPAAFASLVARFDPDVIDAHSGEARIRLVVDGDGEWDAAIEGDEISLVAPSDEQPDAILTADEDTWERVAEDVRGGMDAFRARRLSVRQNLHLGVGFLAATSNIADDRRLRFDSLATRRGKISTLSAGEGDPVVCIHGLGGTKASFLTTVAACADDHRVIALDLPGFGDSDKPLAAAYDAPYFADCVVGLLDELEIERAHLVGNSMGGRVAIETALLFPERVRRLALLSPALAWLRGRQWRWLLQAPLPLLGLVQPAPRAITEPIVRNLVPGGSDGWSAAGVDEFLRSFLTPRGRVAFYKAAREIYLDEPDGKQGFWSRLADIQCDSLFVWGRQDQLVPIGFRKHVERAVPGARHLELECGHVPQLEEPKRTHAAILEFFDAAQTR